MKPFLLALALVWMLPRAALTQEVLDDVFLFRNFTQDARVAPSPFGELSMFRESFETATYTSFAVNAGTPLTDRFEAALTASYFMLDPDFASSSSGLSDLILHGKFNFPADNTRLAAGGFVTLPIGSEEIGEGDLDYGAFFAARHPVSEGTVVTGKVSADYFDAESDDAELTWRLHAGVIRAVSERVALLGELLIHTGTEQVTLAGGLDFALANAGRLRSSLGLGLNDNSSNLSLILGYLHFLQR